MAKVSLDDFLAGKPLNKKMARMMKGELDEEPVESEQKVSRNYADGSPVTLHDCEHLRRMTLTPGWQVLLKLLDTALVTQENSARQNSLLKPLQRKDEIAADWAQLAADKEARSRIERMVETEVARLEKKK